MQHRLAQGWNTWDNNSVLTHVLLPEGLAVSIGFKHLGTTNDDDFLASGIISRRGPDDPHLVPEDHAYDGSYTSLKIDWDGHSVRVESAALGNDLVLLVTPLASTPPSSSPLEATFALGMLWNRPGAIQKKAGWIEARLPARSVDAFLDGTDCGDSVVPLKTPYFCAQLDRAVGFSTGTRRSLDAIRQIIAQSRRRFENGIRSYGQQQELAAALESVVGWNSIYDPENNRVITPPSRYWSIGWGGYALFEWDTYLGASLASVGSRDLAYANAVEMCREITPEGLVPNYARGRGLRSEGRSEPPVGSMVVLDLYNKFHDKWLLKATYPELFTWNRWWARNRDMDGYLVWGDDGKRDPEDANGPGTRQGVIFESGLDNSPMYDDAPFNPATHRLEFADVGLMSLYVADCDALAQIAQVLGKSADAAQLLAEARKYRRSLQTLWSPEMGIFLNKDLRSGKFSTRLSPTNFYPLIAHAATPAQALRMVQEHLTNPKQFWGTWILPSISRSDPAYNDQNYWRGRIWGPMNYLVYQGLRKYDDAQIAQARREMASNGAKLFLGEWRSKGHVHENYNAITGSGDDVENSDAFYSWGGLLGLIELQEQDSAATAHSTQAMEHADRPRLLSTF